MAFLEESPLVGVFPHRTDGPVTDLGEGAGKMRAWQQPTDLLGWGASSWGRDLGTIRTPYLCWVRRISPLLPSPSPSKLKGATHRTRPHGEALPPLPRALRTAECSKVEAGRPRSLGSSYQPWRLASLPLPSSWSALDTSPPPLQLAAPTEQMTPATLVKDWVSGGKTARGS